MALTSRCKIENNQCLITCSERYWFASCLKILHSNTHCLQPAEADSVLEDEQLASLLVLKSNFHCGKTVKVPLKLQETTSQCWDSNFLYQVGEIGWYGKHWNSLSEPPVFLRKKTLFIKISTMLAAHKLSGRGLWVLRENNNRERKHLQRGSATHRGISPHGMTHKISFSPHSKEWISNRL